MLNQFLPQLIVEEFDETQREAGSISGVISFYSDIFCVGFNLISGFLMDRFGRKRLSLGGYAVFSIIMILTPHIAKTIYPGILLSKISMNLALIPSFNTVLVIDYISKESMGITSAFMMELTALA